MDAYTISVIVFVAILAILIWFDRKNFRRDFILLTRRTKRGKNFIIRKGRQWPRFYKWVGNIAIVICFLASIWIFYQLLSITFKNLISTEAIPAAGFLFPSPTSEVLIGPGYFAIPFWYWIISIAILALFHELSHGFMAARERIRIKSLGWGFLAIIPLAFVEIDENQAKKKPATAQLRVFSAGSFANFILAAICFVILSGLVYACFQPTGVGFYNWPAVSVEQKDIIRIANVTNISDLVSFDPNEIVVVETKKGTYYSRVGMLLNQSTKNDIILYEDWPAFRTNLTGMIKRIENWSITNVDNLKSALERIGPEKEIEIETENGTYLLKTAEEPTPKFEPNLDLAVLLFAEHILPGISDLFLSEKSWAEVKQKEAFWSWARESSPFITKRAEEKIALLDEKASRLPKSGFIGISGIYQGLDLKAPLKPYKEFLDFLQGLLFWMFLINLGVGAFNLLPIRGLDGGRMWEILLKRKWAIDCLSTITLFIILANFLFLVT